MSRISNRPRVIVGAPTTKMLAEQMAVHMSGIGPDGKPIVFEACRVPSKNPKKSSGLWAVRRAA